MVVGYVLHPDKEVIMGWLMIGLLALITFNRFAFFSRLTRYQPGAEMGLSSASRPSRC